MNYINFRMFFAKRITKESNQRDYTSNLTLVLIVLFYSSKVLFTAICDGYKN